MRPPLHQNTELGKSVAKNKHLKFTTDCLENQLWSVLDWWEFRSSGVQLNSYRYFCEWGDCNPWRMNHQKHSLFWSESRTSSTLHLFYGHYLQIIRNKSVPVQSVRFTIYLSWTWLSMVNRFSLASIVHLSLVSLMNLIIIFHFKSDEK